MGNLRNLTEPEVFGKSGPELIGNPPNSSIYNSTMQNNISDPDEGLSVSEWVTVYGYDGQHLHDIVHHFFRYGDIIRVEQSYGNWVCLEFARKQDAIQAAKCPTPICIGDKSLVFCRIGRPKRTQKEKKEYELPKINPVPPQEHNTLFDKAFSFAKSLLWI